MGLFGKLFPSFNEKQIKKISAMADKVMALEENYKDMTDDQLRDCTEQFKKRVQEGGEKLDSILPEAFAVVREASWRVLKMKHYYVQVLGGIVLHQGRIAEMRTGEGKTLVATLPAYLNALTGAGMHIVTVNDYLAKRDAEWMGKIYKFLGMKVGVVISGMEADEKRAAYNSDIIYATNNELGFDYLRDNMAVSKEDKLQRTLEFAIIDEVDSILIDEARTPLIISGKGEKSSDLYISANRFVKTLRDEDFLVEEKEKTVRLSEDGVEKAENFFRVENLSDIENQDLVHYINNALKAHKSMKGDKDYIVNDGEVIIIDEFTGRYMIGRRYSNGLHQAIEAKENVRIQNESKTLATITFQNYFRLYKKLSGMTGTAKTEENEFGDIYNLDVLVLPTNVPIARVDEEDQLYTTLVGKYKAAVSDIKKCKEKGQPVLVGTVSVEKSEELSKILTKAKITHNVLNAKNHEKEADIIAQAGKFGAVTIATNMAGRGTDIMLGGNAEFLTKEKLANMGYAHNVIEQATSFGKNDDETVAKARLDYDKYYELFKAQTDAEKARVIEAGGLRILGTERHESRRIDNQLRGRSGRQGDVGSAVFYLSMEDEMIRVFGGEMMQNVANKFNFDEDTPIAQKMITRVIEYAQKRVEDRNFSVRKHVLSYDNVMNAQRDSIYRERNKVLEGLDVHEQVIKMMDSMATEIVGFYADYNDDYKKWDFNAFNRALEESLLESGTALMNEKVAKLGSVNALRDKVMDTVIEQYNAKIEEAKEREIDYSEVERVVMLKTVDNKWIEHIDSMTRLREGIGLRAYGQQDPVLAFRREGSAMFDDMIESIHREIVRVLCKANFERQVSHSKQAKETGTNAEGEAKTVVKGAKVGRNDACPCGSGKKHKMCCGKEM